MQLHQDMDYIFAKHKEAFKVGTITCVGHSLGAALATLAAFDMAQDACVPDHVNVRLCTFEGPKPGKHQLVQIEEAPEGAEMSLLLESYRAALKQGAYRGQQRAGFAACKKSYLQLSRITRYQIWCR